ncbi:MAG: hypothetical protein INR64_17315, partial [Caulobacteraceae bacterium]|nr:hypothetical protein [Caulobacter sp.]
GLFVALGWGAQEAWRRWERARAWLAVAGVAAALGCVGQAGWQAHYWRDGTTLFAHSAAVLPRPCSRLIRLQAIALTEAGGEEEAGMIDQPPRRLADDHHEAAERLARAWLGRDRPDQAIALLQPFAAFSHPDQQALELLADALARAGRTADALAVGRRCARLYPQAGEAHFALADLLRHTGDAPAACVEYEAGLLREGENASALTYLAWAYAHFDDPDAHVRAGELARQAVDLAHGQDRVSLEALAAAEAALDRWPQAVAAAQQALAVTERAGEPADVTTACRARLASYQRGDLP